VYSGGMNLNEKIAAALKEHDDSVMASTAYKSEEAKVFVIKQVHYATEQILKIAQEIRSNIHLRSWKDHGRTPDNILKDMLGWGQPFSQFLWLVCFYFK
jgi:hypothetical protein